MKVAEVRDILGSSGPIATALAGEFEARAEQQRMAEAVARAMESKSHLLVEAGTGVGKSFAYLIPAIIRATLFGEVVVIATNTISLQEQLVQKDIPLLMNALGLDAPPPPKRTKPLDDVRLMDSLMDADTGEILSKPTEADSAEAAASAPAVLLGHPIVRPLKPVLVKGRGNYVSIRRLKLASSRQDRLFAEPAARRSLHIIEEWAYETTDGTLSTLPALERGGVWDKVQSDSSNCMGRKCQHYQECFYQSARRELEGANLLVCNHALFFSDLALRAQEVGFLPAYQHVVLDEAHNVEDVASEHFGVSLAEGRVMHLLTTLYAARSNKGYLPQLSLIAGDTEPVSRAIRLVDDAASATRTFFENLLRLCRERGGESGSIRLREPGMVANVLTPVMRDLSLRLKAIKDLVKNEADKYELNAYAVRAAMIADDAETLVTQSQAGCAYWVEVSGSDEGDGGRFSRGPRVTLACAPVEVAPLLKEHLFRAEHSVVLTSATLATRTAASGESGESAETAFAHAMSRLGCEGAGTLQLGSPFDYATQVDFIIDRGVDGPPAPGSRGGGRRKSPFGAARTIDETSQIDDFASFIEGDAPPSRPMSYSQKLAARVLHHVRETNGGAFVLFTSFATLNAVASELAGPLSKLGMPLLAQGRDGPRGLILQRFRENEQSVLLGAASFWQGVDVRGRGLRNVIITKLPFEPPDRPLTQARCELIESRGGNAFAEDSIPRAVIRFKQGFGRLIRSASDHGRVVVLDARIVTARYGAMFLRALPKGLEPRVIDASDVC